jgi:phage terminase Nu1 subunit (DNA packaging protein)
MTKKPKMPKPSIETIECNSTEGANLLGITQQYFNRIVRDDWIKAQAKNRYRLIDVVQGFKAFLQDEGRRTSKSAEASRVQAARAAQIEFQIAKEKRDVIPVDDVIAALSDIVGIFRSKLTGLPAACTRDPEIREVIQRELDVLITECRDGLNAAGEAVQARRPIVLEPEEADA